MATNPVELQRATARLRIRDGGPNTAVPKIGWIEAGSTFRPLGRVTGEAVLGNAGWFELEHKHFVWSGASEAVPDTAQAAPPAGMKCNCRADGSIEVLSGADRHKVFGTFKFSEVSPRGAVRIDPAWASDNIVQLSTPILAHTGFKKISVHKKAADPFKRVFDKIEAAGLADRILTCGGTWVTRHMGWDPARALSTHSWGAAIDLNVPWNGYGAVPAALGAHGSVRELVPIFESEGFAWGGYFKPQSIADGMHFELSRLDL